MNKPVKKKDTITIVIQGPKKIRQEVVDKVYQAVMDEDLLEKFSSPIAGMTFTSSLRPSDEVMI